MPIFVEWKWVEKTETFLAVFHFWDDATRKNMRMRIVKVGYNLCVRGSEIHEEDLQKEGFSSIYPIPAYLRKPPKLDAFLSWAPSHTEFCFLTELLTYANLLNGLKPALRKKLRPKLEGKETSGETFFWIDSELLEIRPEVNMVSFEGQSGISFEVSLQYVEYIRKLAEPFL